MNVRLTYEHKTIDEMKIVIEMPQPGCMRYDEQHAANMVAVDMIAQIGANPKDWFYSNWEKVE